MRSTGLVFLVQREKGPTENFRQAFFQFFAKIFKIKDKKSNLGQQIVACTQLLQNNRVTFLLKKIKLFQFEHSHL
jgi:hypothetical protein